jgi:diaminohydroxyphosphoribosylaminopyrimidine deaminase / 5-amino-6-(5-phosphoribosylamino)uracil reductase
MILHKHNIQSVIIEGGTKTLETFINAGIWDEARVFSCPVFLKEGVQAPEISSSYKTVTIKNDDLKTIYNYD